MKFVYVHAVRLLIYSSVGLVFGTSGFLVEHVVATFFNVRKNNIFFLPPLKVCSFNVEFRRHQITLKWSDHCNKMETS